MLDVGVRYQRAPSNRSARAFSTPEVSAPASGWPPMKRGSSPRAAIASRLTEPTSVTAVSSPAASSASRGQLGQRPDRRRAEDHLGAVDRLGHRLASGADRAQLLGSRQQLGVRVEARDLGVELAAGRQPDRAADQPDAEDGDLHPGRSVLSSLADRAGQPVQRQHGRLPVHAGVGDRLAVDHLGPGLEVLACPRPGTTPASPRRSHRLPAAIWSAISADDLRLARRGPCRCSRARRRRSAAPAGRPAPQLGSASPTPSAS